MTGFLSPEDSPAAATLPAGTPGWLAGGLGQPGAETSASPPPAGNVDPDGTLVESREQTPAWPAPDTDTPPSARGTFPRAGRGENTGPSSPPEGGPAPDPSGADAVRCTAVPDGPTPLRGQAWRDAVKAAQSRQAAERRNGRGRHRESGTARPRPEAAQRTAPDSDPRLAGAARCLKCGPLPGDTPEAADRASAKHTKDTGHPTAVAVTPREREGQVTG